MPSRSGVDRAPQWTCRLQLILALEFMNGPLAALGNDSSTYLVYCTWLTMFLSACFFFFDVRNVAKRLSRHGHSFYINSRIFNAHISFKDQDMKIRQVGWRYNR